ncbi:MAG: hypothetical protein K2P88_02160 [Chitinophagaceae bacterium]|uniref:hypothetical protein n=1 Tax=unclassified Paraflavitalea TaxID=2798305 RepID=UPI003D346278|nr:hypothetical protein [Chitinophagaceae bacterium]
MALDILVNDLHDDIEKSISLYLDEYDKIMECIENTNDFKLIRSALSDYYGEHEIYIDDLEDLYKETLKLKEEFGSSHLNEVVRFIDDFLGIIGYAVKFRRTIKFIGD